MRWARSEIERAGEAHGGGAEHAVGLCVDLGLMAGMKMEISAAP
ncbi:MAG: hypothetical protein U0359_09305 [Byssovorax sp.]